MIRGGIFSGEMDDYQFYLKQNQEMQSKNEKRYVVKNKKNPVKPKISPNIKFGIFRKICDGNS